MQELAFPTLRTPRPGGFRLKGLALPNEHGSWSILLEPLVAGIAVAPSPAAPFVALIFVAGFLAHQPLRVCLRDLRNGRRMPHTLTVVMLAAFFAILTAVGVIGAWTIVGFNSLVPLLAAAPLALLQLGHDLAGKSRRAVPEIAGAVALSSSAAILAHAAGWSTTSAVALWCIFACRLIPSLLYVRNRLLLKKRKAASRHSPVIAHILALGIVAALAFTGLSPKIVILAFVLLLARAALGLFSPRVYLKAMQIGVIEVVFGFLTVASVVVGHYLHI